METDRNIILNFRHLNFASVHIQSVSNTYHLTIQSTGFSQQQSYENKELPSYNRPSFNETAKTNASLLSFKYVLLVQSIITVFLILADRNDNLLANGTDLSLTINALPLSTISNESRHLPNRTDIQSNKASFSNDSPPHFCHAYQRKQSHRKSKQYQPITDDHSIPLALATSPSFKSILA